MGPKLFKLIELLYHSLQIHVASSLVSSSVSNQTPDDLPLQCFEWYYKTCIVKELINSDQNETCKTGCSVGNILINSLGLEYSRKIWTPHEYLLAKM